MSGAVLASIYAGEIKRGTTRASPGSIPGLHFPAKDITPVHRSDGSGTTFNFTHYLSQVSPGWKAKFGEGTTVSWNGGVGGKGNEGVAGYVKQVPYSIGYVEYAYVIQNKMAYAVMQNAAGKFVAPNAASFAAAASHANWAAAKDFNLVMTNAPGAASYPITATTFVLMNKTPKNATASRRRAEVLSMVAGQGTEASGEPRLCRASRAAGEADQYLHCGQHPLGSIAALPRAMERPALTGGPFRSRISARGRANSRPNGRCG